MELNQKEEELKDFILSNKENSLSDFYIQSVIEIINQKLID